MKSMNILAVAAVLALSSVGLASAQTYHLTGSTAFRNAVMATEVSLCGGTGNSKAIYWGPSSKGLAGANFSIVAKNDGSLAFENFWNGSIAGDIALKAPVTLQFPSLATYSSSMTGAISANVGTLTNASGGTQVDAPTTWPTGVTTDASAPDVAMSDVFFASAQQILKGATPPINVASPADNQVGIIPFDFVINGTTDVRSELGTPGVAPATVALSMDPQKFTAIWSSGGSTFLSLLTANPTDYTNNVTIYPMGRDVDSGTRGTTWAETGYGLKGSSVLTTPCFQFYAYDTNAHYTTDEATATADPTGVAGFGATTGVVGVDSGATSIGDIELVPYESIDGYRMGSPGVDGDGGYYSGGNCATAISTAFASGITDTVLVSYLGASDAKAALTGTIPAVLMAYHGQVFYPSQTFPAGVTSTTNANQIYYGRYTFWGYEHIFGTSGAAAEATTIKNSLVAGQFDVLGSNGVVFGNMKVKRLGDGLTVQ